MSSSERALDPQVIERLRSSGIRIDRLRIPLDPPFPAAWDPVPRTSFAASIVRVETDEGVVGIGSGDTMDGFEPFEHLFLGRDPLAHQALGRPQQQQVLEREPQLAARTSLRGQHARADVAAQTRGRHAEHTGHLLRCVPAHAGATIANDVRAGLGLAMLTLPTAGALGVALVSAGV